MSGLTDRQARAVHAPGGVAITAGAGTGKTHTLGHRYLAHVTGGLSPLAVVAVTFTERAAHELRARVRAYARAAFAHDDPRLAELEAAPIGTVHALRLRICRDHPDAAGVPPDVRILDPLEGEVWWAERLEGALADLPSELFDAMPYERVRDALAVLLRDPYTAERALAHDAEAWRARAFEARADAARQHLASDALQRAEAALAGFAARPAGDAGERARQDVLAALADARGGDPDAAAARIHRRSAAVGAKGTWGDEQDALRAALGVALTALRAWLDDPRARLAWGPADDVLADLLPHLRTGFEAARASLTDAKRRAGVVDFADVEVAALAALRDDDVVAHYRDRWSALLVDEVQDTSPVQEAILARIASFCRTTIVGDPKQSIYGFRGADAAVFERMTRAIEADGGEAVRLDRSFRTHAPLVDASNRAFEALLGEAHDPLAAAVPDGPDDGPPLVHWRVGTPKGASSGVRRLAEAHRIADGILARLEAGAPVRDPDAPGGTRPVRPGDVAVLARTWAPLDLLAEVLPARGVPAVHTGGGDLLATREAQDGIAVLRALADASDDVALVALLRGPAFAVPDDALEAFAEHVLLPHARRDRPSWWDALSRERPAWAERPLEVVGALREAAVHDLPSRLLARLDRATGLSAVAAALPGGPRRAADLAGFLDLVRELEATSGDLYGVVRRIRRLVRAGASVDRPTLEAADAVTLTTVHRAKGLEWPVVVLAALDAGSGAPPPALRMRPELGVAVHVEGADAARETPVAWTLLEAADRAAEEAEDRRLLYVAATRASDLTIVSSAGERGRYLDLLAPGLERAGIVADVVDVEPDDVRWPEAPLPPVPVDTPVDGPAAVPDDLPLDATGLDATGVDAAEDGGGGDDADTEPARRRAWRWARAWVEAIAPELQGVAVALEAAGAPAPEPGEASPIPTPGGARPLLRWARPGRTVVLLEPDENGRGGGAAREGDGLRTVTPMAGDPEATAAEVLRALG